MFKTCDIYPIINLGRDIKDISLENHEMLKTFSAVSVKNCETNFNYIPHSEFANNKSVDINVENGDYIKLRLFADNNYSAETYSCPKAISEIMNTLKQENFLLFQGVKSTGVLTTIITDGYKYLTDIAPFDNVTLSLDFLVPLARWKTKFPTFRVRMHDYQNIYPVGFTYLAVLSKVMKVGD